MGGGQSKSKELKYPESEPILPPFEGWEVTRNEGPRGKPRVVTTRDFFPDEERREKISLREYQL